MKNKLVRIFMTLMLILVSFVSPTASAASRLKAPTGFSYTPTTTSVTLKWDKVKGADAYKVYMLDEGYSEDFEKLYTINGDVYFVYKSVKGTQCTINDLDKGTEYTFIVCALDKNGNGYVEGEKSGAINVKTKSAAKTKTVKKQTKKSSYPCLYDYGFAELSEKSVFYEVGVTFGDKKFDKYYDYMAAWINAGYYVDVQEPSVDGDGCVTGGGIIYYKGKVIAYVNSIVDPLTDRLIIGVTLSD
ncbi:MAG: fibronectin type III domain-containing protein [Oscillospiraceae bacterium]|nr:fibronectin type III domain-containing protein [Oscillospiraceae bacterium]